MACPTTDVDHAQVKPPPDLGGQVNTDFIRLAAVSDNMIMLLDVDKLIGGVSRIARLRRKS
jgi:chemotaxis signal transduction protein